MAKQKMSFRGKIKASIKERKEKKNKFSYINLPTGVKLFEVKKDTRSIHVDILPYIVSDEKHPERNDKYEIAVPGTPWFRRPFLAHKNIGSENVSIICPRSFGHKCPICEHVKERMKNGESWDDVSEIAAKKRSLFYVIPVDSDEYEDDTICIWDISDFLFWDELEKEIELDEENEDFASLDAGKTLEVGLRWKQFGKNDYYETRFVKFNDREPFDESILEEIESLDNVFKVLSYEEIHSLFYEMDAEEIDESADEDEDDAPKVKRIRKTVAKDEEDEEEEKPVRRSRRVKEEPVEDIQEEEEDDQEEEKPKRGARTAKPAAKKETKNKCPYGHEFGADCEKYDDCDTCDVYDDCLDESEK